MKTGTKSVLFGAHCFFLHPFFVAYSWYKLYGFPLDPRLWIAFFVHDLGYIGKPNMDGEEGELHPYFGAKIMRIFGKKWFEFTLYHSRFLAKNNNAQYSKLCVADKLSFYYTPIWLYLPMVNWTGEIKEYMKLAGERTAAGEPKYSSMKISTDSQHKWHNDVALYLYKWAQEHKEIKADTWTPAQKVASTTSGVWQ